MLEIDINQGISLMLPEHSSSRRNPIKVRAAQAEINMRKKLVVARDKVRQDRRAMGLEIWNCCDRCLSERIDWVGEVKCGNCETAF